MPHLLKPFSTKRKTKKSFLMRKLRQKKRKRKRFRKKHLRKWTFNLTKKEMSLDSKDKFKELKSQKSLFKNQEGLEFKVFIIKFLEINKDL